MMTRADARANPRADARANPRADARANLRTDACANLANSGNILEGLLIWGPSPIRARTE